MQQIYSNTSKVMVDTKGQGQSSLSPLDKLMQAATVSAATASTAFRPAGRRRRSSIGAIVIEAPPQLGQHRRSVVARILQTRVKVRCVRVIGRVVDESAPESAGAVVATLLVVIAMSVFSVDQRQFALVFQLGEVKRAIDEPGLNFKVPMVQNVRYFESAS